MNKFKKTFLWVAGVFIILLALFFLLARHVINLEPVKTEVVNVFSEKTGGQLAYEKAEISFFPQYRIVLHSVNFSIPEKISGNVESLALYPSLLSLLKGKVKIAEFKALAPDLIVFNTELSHKKPGKKFAPAEMIGSAVTELETIIPNLGVDIEQGRLAVSDKNGPVFWFRKISAHMVSTGKKSLLRLDCQSNLWDRLSAHVELNRKNPEINGQININGFQPHRITGHLFPHALRKISTSRINLTMNFQGTEANTIHGRIKGDIPVLTLKRGEIQTDVEVRSIRSAFRINRDIIEVVLDDMEISRPRLSLSGKLKKDRSSSRISLELEGRDIDVTAARKTVLAAAGD
ncbi:MAG: hypothetical protein JRI38_05755, partial [Deltaproteobacteria bacterium]|nr:hypothetical protein [Deltaproteobacteria bacterium]